MNLPELCIRRPVMTTLVMLGILLFGVMSYRLLPVSDLPNVDRATISVSASLPGASPETIASTVATPLEKQFSTIAGLDPLTSTSQLGSTQITLQFTLSRDIDAAAQDVQAAIAQAQRQLPREMPAPPNYRKVNPAGQPFLMIALTSPTLALSQLDEYGETLMAQRISMVDGLAQVMVFGSQKYAVRVQFDPRTLAGLRLSSDDLDNAIQNGNVNPPTGVLYGQHRAFTVEATGQLEDAAYRPLIVPDRNGSPIRLQDVARVIDSVENDMTAAWFVDKNGPQRSIILAVQRQPGTNTVKVANAVKELLPAFEEQLPASVSMHILFDQSRTIKASADDVQFTLLLTLCLVVMVIFLFLRNVSATVIPSLTLPMSIVGTFTVMYLLNYSLDNLSLMALALSVGFVVDDAIVMLEKIFRHMEMGQTRLQAALEGSREIGFTVISMTLSLAAVFIPVLFMGGLVGRLFREFAVTIGVAVLVSGFVSLTLTLMRGSRFLKPPGEVHHGRIYAVSEAVFQGMLRLYGWSLSGVLRRRLATMLVYLGVLVGTVWLFRVVPKGFIPSEDRGQLNGGSEAAEDISYSSLVQHQQALAEVIRQDPNVDSFMSSAGGRGFGGANTGNLFLRLKPKGRERKLSADEVLGELRRKTAQVPGIRTFLQNPPVVSVGGRTSRSLYQFTLQSPDIDELHQAAAGLERRLRELPGFLDVTSDLRISNPKVTVQIERDKAQSYGVTAAQIETALYDAYGSRQVSTILAPNNEYQVIMESQPQYQLSPHDLELLYIRSAKGQPVPLSAVSRLSQTVGPLSINHSGQLPSVTVSFNLGPGVSLGEAVERVKALARDLPATVSTSFQGTAQEFEKSMQGMILLLVLAVLVIYMVLGILYESFIHPLTILTALPFAGFGALATLMLFNVELSLYAFVGIIMLVGLVKKNGIMMIDFAIQARRTEGLTPREAIYQACLIRFRPIMMTTLAALMAGLPIALGYGAWPSSAGWCSPRP